MVIPVPVLRLENHPKTDLAVLEHSLEVGNEEALVLVII
jgi:hypothetical protein